MKPSYQEVSDKVLYVLRDLLDARPYDPRGTLTPTSKLEDLDIDSLDQVEVQMALEDFYDIHFEDEELAPVTTVEELIQLTLSKFN